MNTGESNGLAQHSQNDSSCAWDWVCGELEERDLSQPVTSRSFRSFISLLVINGSASFLMEGNREEMVSCLHLSGICLKGRSPSLEIGQGCVFPGMSSWAGWGWMSDVWMMEDPRLSCVRPFPSPSPSLSPGPCARDTLCPAAAGWKERV